MSIAIIGIGSPYGADQTGWQLLDMLRQDGSLQDSTNEKISFTICEYPGLMLLDYMAGYEHAILLDAVEGGRRGKVVRLGRQQLLDDISCLSTHGLDVKEVLMLGGQLNCLPLNVDLIGIEVGDASLEYRPEPETVIQVKNLVYDAIQKSSA